VGLSDVRHASEVAPVALPGNTLRLVAPVWRQAGDGDCFLRFDYRVGRWRWNATGRSLIRLVRIFSRAQSMRITADGNEHPSQQQQRAEAKHKQRGIGLASLVRAPRPGRSGQRNARKWIAG